MPCITEGGTCKRVSTGECGEGGWKELWAMTCAEVVAKCLTCPTKETRTNAGALA